VTRIPIPEGEQYSHAHDLRLAARAAVERHTPWTQPTGGVYRPRPRHMDCTEAWPLANGWTWCLQ